MAGQNTIGAKEELEHKLASHKKNRMKSLSKLERFYKSDTANIPTSTDSLIALWHREPYPKAWYKLSLLYLERSDSVNLFNTLDSIPLIFELSLYEQLLHQQYEDLVEILWTLQADTINLDSTMTQSLLSLSFHATLPGTYARNLLINDSIIDYDEPVYFPDFLKTIPFYPVNPDKSKTDYIMKVFPNPAGNYFIVEYDLSESVEHSFFMVSDAMGKRCDLIYLENTHTQKIISTNEYSDGVYLLQLYLGNNFRLPDFAPLIT